LGLAARALLVALAALVGGTGCSKPTEIILVVDTNLAIDDIDDVKLDITGTETKDIDVPIGRAAASFPLTLGLLPSGTTSSVEVSVVAYLQGAPVVSRMAQTNFVENEQKILPLLLLDDCVGLTCPATPVALTCSEGSCVSSQRELLDDWSGHLPPRPDPASSSSPKPLGGHTLWSNGWRSCANEGAVLYCWGANSDGQIGDGTLRDANSRHPVMGLKDLATVGLGQVTSCACDTSGQAWCWGRNVEGELGIEKASPNAKTPVKVSGVTDCAQIAGGAQHVCAVHGNGTVSCWGSNENGQLGVGSSATLASCAEGTGSAVPCATAPMLVKGLTDVVEIKAGEQHTCARKSDKTVVCWGLNDKGQLGDGTNTSRATPVAVVGLPGDAVELACGRWFNCVVHPAGTISCWGDNGSGQLGSGNTKEANRPVQVVGISDAVQIGAGLLHACALVSAGQVSCWGANNLGQLGDGTGVNSLMPVRPANLQKVNTIAIGSVHSCARATTGATFCWGENLVNQLGEGKKAQMRLEPVSVAGFQ